MTTDPGPNISHARARTGVVQALGILNILFATLLLIYVLAMTFYTAAALSATASITATPAVVDSPKGQPTQMPVINANLFTAGWDDSKFVRFTIFDLATGFLLNLAMLGTGIGLLNLFPWAARWWAWAAWIKIVRLVMVWGYFIVAIAPTLAEKTGKAVAVSMAGMPGRPVTAVQLIQIYNYLYLFMSLAIMIFGLIYPAVSLWVISRPGVKAALLPSTTKEADFS